MSIKVFKNKLLLSFLSVLLVFQLFMISLFAPRVDAAVPLAAPLAAALGSFVLDMAIDMGIRFVDEKAKTDFKDKAVGDIWSKYGDEVKDLKPTKKNAGKWLLEIPKWLTGYVVDYIADTAVEVVKGDQTRRQNNQEVFQLSAINFDEVDPFYNTSVSVDLVPSTKTQNAVVNARYLAYLKEWTDIRIKPIAYAQRTEIAFAWRGDFDNALKVYVGGGFSGKIYFSYAVSGKGGSWQFSLDDDINVYNKWFLYSSNQDKYLASYVKFVYYDKIPTFSKGLDAFWTYLEKLENSHGKIFYSDGMITTEGYDAYLNFPNTTSDGQVILYKPEAIEQIKHPAIKPIELEFELKDLNLVSPEWNEVKEGDQFEWEIIKNDIDNQVTNNTFNTTHHIINNYNKIDYNTVINNYYTTENEIVVTGDVDLNNGNSNKGDCNCLGEIEVGEDAVINVGDGAVINIEDVDDGFFDKLVGVFVPDDFTFVEQQVKRLMKLINDKLPTADLQDMFNSIFVASEKNPLEDLDIEISSLGLRFDFPDVDDDWIAILKRVVIAVVVLYTLVYIYRRVFGNNGVMEK